MKKDDQKKIAKALHAIVQFKWQADADGGNEYKRGMASLAEVMLDLVSAHGGSYEYRAALNQLVTRAPTLPLPGFGKNPIL